MRAVDFVNHHDGQQPLLQRLAQHETGLRLRAFVGIHHQNNTVHHLHHTLHLRAEIRVSRGVNDVNGVIVPVDGRVLGLDSDTLLTLQVHGIHGALLYLLIFSVGSAGLQQLVNEGRFAMVHVGNDGEIAELGGIAHNI